jgi:hypothetical protein
VTELDTTAELDTAIPRKDLLRNANGTLVLPAAADEDDELPTSRGPELNTRRAIVKFQNRVIRQCYLKKLDRGTALALVGMTNTVFEELSILEHQEPMEERLAKLEESREFLP